MKILERTIMGIISNENMQFLLSCLFVCCHGDTFDYGYKLSNFTYNNIYNIGKTMCALDCIKSSDCASANYHLYTHTCELNSEKTVDVSPNYTIHVVGMLYGDKSDFVQEYGGPCSYVYCPPLHECVVFMNKDTRCIALGCMDYPPSLFDGFQSDNVSLPASIGTEVQYNCSTGLVLIGYGASVCDTNGTWTLPGECKGCKNAPVSLTNAIQSTSISVPAPEGSVVTYQCNDFSSINGSNESTCKDGQWTSVGECVYDCSTKPGYESLVDGVSCYKIHTVGRTNLNAQTECENEGSRLLRFNGMSQASIISGYTNLKFWIDGTDAFTEKTWLYNDETESGIDKDHVYWCSGRPKTDPANQYDCMTLAASCITDGEFLYDEKCDEQLYFICEFFFP